MDFDEELSQEKAELGSDELLSDDNLRLSGNAHPLARLHALRAWLAKRQKETNLEMDILALDMQLLQQGSQLETRLRRSELQARQAHLQSMQTRFRSTQQLLNLYEEAERLLEECVDHTTVSERLLVEYYLTIEALVHDAEQTYEGEDSLRLVVLNDVLQRIEQVGVSHEED